MATNSGAGLKREVGELWTIRLKDSLSLDDAGYVLQLVSEGGVSKVDKCSSAGIPYAVNYMSTRDPSSIDEPPTKFLTGLQIGAKGINVFREGWASLKVATNNSAIVVGDPLVCVGGGKINKYTPTVLDSTNVTTLKDTVDDRFDELARIVGHAEEEIPAGTTSGPGKDKVMAKVSIRSVGINS